MTLRRYRAILSHVHFGPHWVKDAILCSLNATPFDIHRSPKFEKVPIVLSCHTLKIASGATTD